MSVGMTGFEELLKSIDESPDKLQRGIVVKAHKLSERIAGQARQGAPVDEGRLRNSIQGYVEVHGDVVEGGAKTDYPPAIYHEFGTGPVGDANPHPMDGELGITRRPDGWTYYSEDVVGQPLPSEIKFGKHKGELRTPPGQVSNGLVYTEGVPAKAFMYNALVANEDEITKELGATVSEVFR